MVVLAASIITKTGKALLSRQFVDMSRMRIEGLLAAFPKLVGIGKQHTYVETDEVRYLYQPLESLYLLLITTKQSNVLEDLETLRMLVKIIEKAKYEGAQGSYSSATAMGSGPINITGFDMNGDGAGGGFGNGNAFASMMDMEPSSKPAAAKVSAPGKGSGMKLGKSQKANKLLESLKAEGEITESDVAPPGGQAKTALRVAPTDPISVVIEEKLTCVLKKEGGLDSLGVMGTISLEVQKEEDAFVRVQLETGANHSFKFRPHPNIDKALYAKEKRLGLRDPSKPFPTCTAVGILKWIMQTKDESLVPLTDGWLLKYDARRSVLEWVVEHIDNTNRNGSLEFVVPATDTSVFFPMDVKFTATKLYCDIKATSVLTTSGNPVKAAIRTALVVDSYQIV
ncbi:hypothetical protein CBR_g30127 [Chara braunii]|uniref:Coatomer subunit delta n=1 Tax=Chara braunii TaxID=69332 RepID=A0A388LCF0_CHABU|nr:hypothetical protein CBR_g30127 [Chara braunii]|eukprot:GBG79862.1 hypothetical protein CBR_g30127 [Chara braunii]